jgi:flagellar basal-body rod modification protein FlgD
MAVDPTGPLSTPTSASNQVQRDNSTLGKDDFLKILVGELQNMDPMSQSSSDPSQTTMQMTQFSILEQLTNLANSDQSLVSSQKQAQAMSLLGKSVDYTLSDGTSAQGSVRQVDFASDGSVNLTVDGQSGVTLAQVTGVK